MYRYLDGLPKIHQYALNWFVSKINKVVPYPERIGNTLLATRAKGIYKPAWSKYALSIRESLSSSYPDTDPIYRQDGTWSYQYFQEGSNPLNRDKFFTNRAMMDALNDEIPIGVMIQVSSSPTLYKILGLALVVRWNNGFFYLEGFSKDGIVSKTKSNYI